MASKASSSKLILVPGGVNPTAQDIICGRPSTSKHPGNQAFRLFIIRKAPVYMQASKKSMKSQIVADSVDSLQATGARFIKYDNESKTWGILLPKDAREKVSHAIRDRVREIRLGIRNPQSPTVSESQANQTESNNDSSHPNVAAGSCSAKIQSSSAFHWSQRETRSFVKEILDAAKMIDQETFLQQQQQKSPTLGNVKMAIELVPESNVNSREEMNSSA